MSTVITPEELYQNYHEKVERYISSRVPNVHDRADLKQQVFLNAIAALDGYDPARSAPGTWLYTITRNVVIDFYRRRNREPMLTELETLDQQGEVAHVPEVDERLLTQETQEMLADALEQLPERERDIVIFRFYHGLSAQETAARVGVSYANVRVLQHNALRKLRKVMNQNFLY